MARHVYLEFESDEKINAFMNSIHSFWYPHITINSTIGGSFTRKEIETAIEQFGARIIEKPKR
jgi:hypothetical protein